MKARCSNPNNPHYKWYGAKGITVCIRWQNFDNFFEDMGEAPDKLTIERKDSSQGYSPENCIWATRLEQQQNISSNHNLTFSGKTLSVAAWAREVGVVETTLRNRIKRGWNLKDALNPQLRRGCKYVEKTSGT